MIRFELRESSALALFVAGAIALAGCGSSSDSGDPTPGDTLTFEAALGGTLTVEAALDGAQTVPSVATGATGSVSITLDTTTGAISGTITHQVVDATVAHIHSGAIGETGGPIVNFDEVRPGEFSVPEGSVLTVEQISAFEAGNLYVNVHSALFPGGEIRGQLTNDTVVIPVLATLDSIQARVFTPNCSACHTGDDNMLPGVMNLSSADDAFAALVGIGSIQESELDRVVAGDADSSYIIVKLEGRHSVGSQMPMGQEPLDEQTIAAMRQWIDDGALR